MENLASGQVQVDGDPPLPGCSCDGLRDSQHSDLGHPQDCWLRLTVIMGMSGVVMVRSLPAWQGACRGLTCMARGSHLVWVKGQHIQDLFDAHHICLVHPPHSDHYSRLLQVVEALRELPYSRATVELMHDAEEVEAVQQAALDAAVQVSM